MNVFTLRCANDTSASADSGNCYHVNDPTANVSGKATLERRGLYRRLPFQTCRQFHMCFSRPCK